MVKDRAAIKQTVTFFLLVTLAGALAHYLIVLLLSQALLESGPPGLAYLFIASIYWVLILPMKFLITSPFGQSLSPLPLQMLFVANSVLWGLLLATVILWRRLRNE